MSKRLYRIDFKAAADIDLSTDFEGMPDPLRSLIIDNVLVPVEDIECPHPHCEARIHSPNQVHKL